MKTNFDDDKDKHGKTYSCVSDNTVTCMVWPDDPSSDDYF